MAIIEFSKFSPGGNDTLFLHEPLHASEECARAFAKLGGEQWGRADTAAATLAMGGDEFCINAARAFGALLDMRKHGMNMDCRKTSCRQERAYCITVSGWPGQVDLMVTGSFPQWRIAARLPVPHCPIEIINGSHCLVHLPGIRHLLYFGGDAALPEYAEHIRAAEDKQRHLPLNGAHGIVHCRTIPAGHAILPYVVVPGAGTAMIEGACGSASLALALALFLKTGKTGKFVISQPRSTLEVTLAKTSAGLCAEIAGPVIFMASGLFNTCAADDAPGGNTCAE